jgi:hypothetical protein
MMLSAFLLAASAISILAPGDPLPPLKSQSLSGQRAVLPDAAFGRVSLVAMGFTYNSRFAVEAWIRRFSKDFGDNPQVTFYQVAMIGGIGRLGKLFIESGMRKDIPKSEHERVITVYGGTDAWKKRVGFQSPDAAYLILLDKNGVVRWLHGGPFDEGAYRSLTENALALIGK